MRFLYLILGLASIDPGSLHELQPTGCPKFMLFGGLPRPRLPSCHSLVDTRVARFKMCVRSDGQVLPQALADDGCEVVRVGVSCGFHQPGGDGSMGVVTLITDFGTRDYYLGAMKGIILGIAPAVRIIDITHEIEPYNVLQAAFTLRQIWCCYPPETVHLVVVDPGVGSDRRIILGQCAGRCVVAPDNGLVTLVHRDMPPESMRVVENRRYFGATRSATFHGRDIMAPVAAHLAGGVSPHEFGRVTDQVELLPVKHRAEAAGDRLIGRVLFVDRFGTMVTNIHREQLEGEHQAGWGGVVLVNGQAIGPIATTFSDAAIGEPVAFVGSADFLEISVNRGRAVDRFGPPDSAQIVVG